MAGDATDIVLAVNGIDGVHVLGAAGVAGEAAGVDFFRGSVLEQENLCFVAAAGDVVGAGAVAAFATLLRGTAFGIEGGLPVRSFLPAGVNLLVTGLAGFGAQVFGGFRRWSSGHGCAGRLNILSGSLRRGLLGSEGEDEKAQKREEKRSKGSGFRWHEHVPFDTLKV